MLRQRNDEIGLVFRKGLRRSQAFDQRHTLADRRLPMSLQLRCQPAGAGFAIGNPMRHVRGLDVSRISQNAVGTLGEQLFN